MKFHPHHKGQELGYRNHRAFTCATLQHPRKTSYHNAPSAWLAMSQRTCRAHGQGELIGANKLALRTAFDLLDQLRPACPCSGKALPQSSGSPELYGRHVA